MVVADVEMAKVNMFFFFGLLVYLSTLLHDATARGRKRLFSKRFQFQSDSLSSQGKMGSFIMIFIVSLSILLIEL